MNESAEELNRVDRENARKREEKAIWTQAFMASLHLGVTKAAAEAETALEEWARRWPA